MDKNKRFDGEQQRSLCSEDFEIRVLNEEERVVELSFSSETPVRRWGAYEVLSHKSDAVQLDRINSTGCLLFNHNRDKVIGKILEAKVKNKRGIAKVQFDDDEESIVYFNKVKNKTLRGVSVGYIILETERHTKGKGKNAEEIFTATKWEPIEISIVSVPADITVGVGRSMTEAADDKPYRSRKMLDNIIKINSNEMLLKEETK